MKVSLIEWAAEIYKNPPPIGTLRRWARNGNIYPPPEIEGREYKVEQDAFYIKPNKYSRAVQNHQPRGRISKKCTLLEKLINVTEARKV